MPRAAQTVCLPLQAQNYLMFIAGTCYCALAPLAGRGPLSGAMQKTG